MNNLEKSATITKLIGALAEFHKEVSSISKDAKNPFFKSNYATLSNIQDEIKEPLAKAGLVYSQFPTGLNSLTTLLMHTSGEYIQSLYEMTPAKADPQGQGSAITYMRRYALTSILGLNVEDDDGNTATKGISGVTKLVKANDIF